MTDRSDIERLLNQTGRTLNDLPERYPVDKIMAVGRLRGVNIKEAGKTILHQSDVIELLVSALKDALEKQPKWISVKERLPVKQFRVIVRTGHGLVTTGWRSYHVDVRGGELWEVDGAHNYHNDVTHWMPLPSAEGLK